MLFVFMKKILLVLLSAGVLVTAACSRSDKTETTKTAQPQSTPDAAKLKSDSERLQKATANAAKARENAATATPTLTPSTTP